MRLLWAAVGAGCVVACTAAPGRTIIIERDHPAEGIVIHDPAPEVEAGADAGPVDGGATDVADAAPATCTGPAPMGPISSNCVPVGACSLGTCSIGEAYSCKASPTAVPDGYPEANITCVYSAADSKNGARVHCCERACVRENANDLECQSKGPAIAHGYRCPQGVAPPTKCQAFTSTGLQDAYCCP
jgi:hypothetical protein